MRSSTKGLTRAATGVWTLLPLPHNINKAIHGFCQITCLCLVMASLGIVWNFKGDVVPHIQAIHEYMGITTLVLYSCQVRIPRSASFVRINRVRQLEGERSWANENEARERGKRTRQENETRERDQRIRERERE